MTKGKPVMSRQTYGDKPDILNKTIFFLRRIGFRTTDNVNFVLRVDRTNDYLYVNYLQHTSIVEVDKFIKTLKNRRFKITINQYHADNTLSISFGSKKILLSYLYIKEDIIQNIFSDFVKTK